jgi:hypothetical protein
MAPNRTFSRRGRMIAYGPEDAVSGVLYDEQLTYLGDNLTIEGMPLFLLLDSD